MLTNERLTNNELADETLDDVNGGAISFASKINYKCSKCGSMNLEIDFRIKTITCLTCGAVLTH